MRRAKIKTRVVVFSILSAVIVNVLFMPFFASAKTASYSSSESASSWLYFNAMSYCIQNFDMPDGWNHDRITEADAKAGNWFAEHHVQQSLKFVADDPAIGYAFGYPDNNGHTGCNQGYWVLNAFTMWQQKAGKTVDMIDAICGMGVVRANGTDCKLGSGDFKGGYRVPEDLFYEDRLTLDSFLTYTEGLLGINGAPQLSKAAQYIEERNALFTGCLGNMNAKPIQSGSTVPTDEYTYSVFNIDKNGNYLDQNGNKQKGPTYTKVNFYGTKKQSESIEYYADGASNSNNSNTCGGLLASVNSNAPAYASASAKKPDSGGFVGAGGSSASGGSKSSCTIPGLGWIICPVINILASIADAAYKYLEDSFLQTNVKFVDTNSDTFKAWEIMRNFANVAFVIGFLVIIFSQLTGYGIDNYGIKKLLPKIIIAAILVNISFYICQIAVDLSNIVGHSLRALLDAISPIPTTSGGAFSGGNSWLNIAGGVIGGAVGATVIYLNLSALVPVLVTAVLALVLVLFILVARQALIVLLIIIAPLAFIAYLLPNTENWFKSWRKIFTGLLLVYPIVALIYGAATFASRIMSNVMGGDPLAQIIAAATGILPLFLIPVVLKKSLNGIGNVGATINGWSSKVGGAAGKRAQGGFDNSALGQFQQYRSGQKAQRMAEIQTGSYNKQYKKWYDPRNLRNVRSNVNQAINDRSGGFGAQRASMAAELEDKNVAKAEAAMKGGSNPVASASAQLESALLSGDTVSARAATRVLSSSGSAGLDAAQKAIARAESKGTLNGAAKSKVQQELLGAKVKGKNAVLHEWGKGSTDIATANKAATFAGLSSEDLAGQSADLLRTAIGSGGITDDQAAELLKNDTLRGTLDSEQLGVLKGHAGAKYP